MKKKLKLNKIKIPVNKPYVSNQDIKSVNTVLKNGWISSDGAEVKSFEEKFSKKIKRKYSIAVSSCTVIGRLSNLFLYKKNNFSLYKVDFFNLAICNFAKLDLNSSIL